MVRGAARGLSALLVGLAALACGDAAVDSAAELARWRGENALAEDRADFARIYFAEARSASDDPQLLRSEALAWLSGYQQSLSTGAELLSAYIEKEPGDSEARRRLAATLEVLGREQEARALLEHPLCDGCTMELASSWVGEDPARALGILERWQAESGSVADSDRERAAQIAARAAVALELADALERCEEALSAQPLQVEIWYLLATEALRRGDRERAARALEVQRHLRVLFEDGTLGQIPPEETLSTGAALRELLGERPWQLLRLEIPALAALGRADELRSRVAELWGQEAPLAARLEAATAAGDVGLRGFAQELFGEVLEIEPTHRGAIASLALLEIEANELEAAVGRLEAAVSGDPHFARYRLLLGRALARGNELDAAERELRLAVDLAPWQDSWRLELVELLRARGSRDWRSILEQAPETTPALQAARRQLGLDQGVGNP